MRMSYINQNLKKAVIFSSISNVGTYINIIVSRSRQVNFFIHIFTINYNNKSSIQFPSILYTTELLQVLVLCRLHYLGLNYISMFE